MKASCRVLVLASLVAILSGCGGSRVAAPIAEDPPAPPPVPGPPPRLVESVFTIEAHGSTLVSSIFEGIARSTDAGESWTIVNPNYALRLVRDGTRIFAASTRGVLRSADDGLTWQTVQRGLSTSSTVYDLSVEGSTVAAAFYQDDLVYVSNDLGDSWQSYDLPGSVRAQSVLVHAGVIYAGTTPGYVYRSSDGGQTWTPQQTGEFRYGVRALAAHNGKLFAGVSMPLAVLVSTDGGVHWEPSQNGLPTGDGGRWLYSITSRGPALYAGTAGGLYRSSDDGATWVRLGLGGDPQLTVMDSDELGGSMFAGTIGNGVHRSSDDGATWVRLNDVGTRGDPVISVDGVARP